MSDDDLEFNPIDVVHLPTVAQAARYNGTNAAAIAEWAEELADYQGGLLILHTKQGDMTPDVGDFVILDRSLPDRDEHEIWPIKQARYHAVWARVGES